MSACSVITLGVSLVALAFTSQYVFGYISCRDEVIYLIVVHMFLRAPELLLGSKQYSTAIDMWSLGCIMAELLSKEPLFNGRTEFDQLDKVW